MDTRHRARIDCIVLDIFFSCAGCVVAFRLAVGAHAKDTRTIRHAGSATDALVFVNPRCFCHNVSPFDSGWFLWSGGCCASLGSARQVHRRNFEKGTGSIRGNLSELSATMFFQYTKADDTLHLSASISYRSWIITFLRRRGWWSETTPQEFLHPLLLLLPSLQTRPHYREGARPELRSGRFGSVGPAAGR